MSFPKMRTALPGRETPVMKRQWMNVKVDAAVVRKAKVVAAARHITLSDYVTDLLRSAVGADLARVAAGLAGAAAACDVAHGDGHAAPPSSDEPPALQLDVNTLPVREPILPTAPGR
jgi:hypothetical protein